METTIWVKEEVRESWASAVEWYLGDKEYSELGLDLYAPITWVGTSGFSAKHLQHLTISGGDFDGHNAYTPLFIDMIDRFNQSVEFDNDICEYGGTFDQQNCFVMEPPEGETAFIANNNFYYTPAGVSSCPIANTSFDSGEGACPVMDIPAGASAFVYLNKMYFEPTQDEDYPFDGVWDFTIQNLELNVLDPSNSFDDVLSELKSHKPTHVMDVHLDKYFETYGQY
jgi:hypothetical protein